MGRQQIAGGRALTLSAQAELQKGCGFLLFGSKVRFPVATLRSQKIVSRARCGHCS
jgi:hypothetical protein